MRNTTRSLSAYSATARRFELRNLTQPSNYSFTLYQSQAFHLASWTNILLKLEYQGRIFELNNYLHVKVTRTCDGWTIENSPLGIFAFGESKDEALRDFQLEFACCWDSIAEEDPANLTVDAQRLKLQLQNLVSEVSNRQWQH